MVEQGSRLTLWDLAEAVWEEVEEVFGDECIAREISNIVLHRLICTCVRNMEVKEESDLLCAHPEDLAS